MRISTASLCALPLFLSSVVSQDNRAPDPNNHFISPPLPGPQANVNATVFWSNQNWTVGVQQSIDWNWVTNITNLRITMEQEGAPGSVQSHMILDCPLASEQNNYYWDGNIDPIDLKNGSIAYLAAWDCDTDSTPYFFSHYINLTEPVDTTASTTTSSTASASSTTSASSTLATAVSTTSSASSTATSEGDHSGGGGSSNAAALGGGIGGGIGGALVLIALGALFLYWRRGKRKALRGAQGDGNSSTMGELLPTNQHQTYPPYQGYPPPHSYQYQPQQQYPSEMPGSPYQQKSNVELDSNQSHSGHGS
ncbi:hypothetical protein H2200_003374 [Cladophialophora chaetospira]|uniref:Mid2 domain-containing protein n=1 Tax=Cladophialophora chaetospira TaxID=386627 RepID=A0AA39CM82_9EURO|nr:hypothetical protein H2200_003374 [Cladophialophora chaetospira]